MLQRSAALYIMRTMHIISILLSKHLPHAQSHLVPHTKPHASNQSYEKNPKHCFVCTMTNHTGRDYFFQKTKPMKKNTGPLKPQVNVLEMGAPSTKTQFRSFTFITFINIAY